MRQAVDVSNGSSAARKGGPKVDPLSEPLADRDDVATINGRARMAVIAAMVASYVLFAIMMNSVGIVILQAIRELNVSKPQASLLEAMKDLSVVISAVLLAPFLLRLGLRRAIIIVELLLAVACVAMRLSGSFAGAQLLFACTGLAFGIAKIVVYAAIGVVASGPREHASLTALVEGAFMIGLMGGVGLFGQFIGHSAAPGAWLDVYWWLGLLAVAAAVLWLFAPADLSASPADVSRSSVGWLQMLKLAALPSSMTFLTAAFFYVLIEQSVGTWLPTFTNQVLHVPAATSVELSALFAGSIALGRLTASALLTRVRWIVVVQLALLAMALVILGVVPLTRNIATTAPDLAHLPAAAWMLPMIGLFMAPIYPVLNSVALSAIPKSDQVPMVGLIVLFSALGGTSGSYLMGLIFARISGPFAFYCTLVPIATVSLISIQLYRTIEKGRREINNLQ